MVVCHIREGEGGWSSATEGREREGGRLLQKGGREDGHLPHKGGRGRIVQKGEREGWWPFCAKRVEIERVG